MDLPGNDIRAYIQDNGKEMWIAHNNHNIRYFNEEEIRVITNNYSTILGKGAFGEVYRGVLEDTSPVAVKRYIHNVKEEFAKEVIVHCEINHRNVVRLIGCCINENALMMVTEYISKGNLSDILHCSETFISLETRLEIAIGCAEALSYMHSQMYGQVIHGDIKPANILLDESLNAKISDFGISKLLSTDKTLYTTHVIGSIGYMDPFFVRTGRLTSKSDVYSFGVVLLELISRRKAIDDDGTISLTEDFTRALSKKKKIRELFDVEIADVDNMKILEQIGKLAAKCLAMEIDIRPEMKDVAECLRVLRKSQYQREDKVALFRWAWGSKQAPKSIISIDKLDKPPTEKATGREGRSRGLISIGPSQPIDLGDLLRASAEVLGRSKFASTYKATLENGDVYVIKRLRDCNVPMELFKEHIAEIGAIEHELIVSLRGYYYSKDEKLLVYSYLCNGSISSKLHGKRINKAELFSWETRSAIAISSARAIAYIHSTSPTAAHGNIKSSNILLTGDNEARLSEHGIITLYNIRNSDVGYLTVPEVKGVQTISQKADVYSFGILLLELLTGKPPTSISASEDPDLIDWIMSVPQEQWTVEVLDLTVSMNNSVVEEMLQFLQLAIHCCEQSPNLRPEMSEVAQQIEQIRGSTIMRNNWSTSDSEEQYLNEEDVFYDAI